jgi:CubicO group peptidase (beta-lactamase class C family)
VLVIRNGYLVFEQYRRNWKESSRHHLQSVTKSFTSTLVGIAIEEGFIEDVDQGMMDFFPDRTIANLDSRKQNITIKDLLTMSEGMDWHEVDLPYDHPDNSLGQMWRKDDVIQFVLDQPMIRDPGEAWNYNSGTSILLGNIVEQAAGQDMLSFARQYLFDPLGIGGVNWDKADDSHYHTDGGLYMVPRDMARLGYLMLRDGVWEGNQILPPGWVSEASKAHFQTNGSLGYGYQWWTSPQIDIYSARGHYDQAIYVIPEADLVVVFTANIPDEAIHPEDGLLIRYILGPARIYPASLPTSDTRIMDSLLTMDGNFIRWKSLRVNRVKSQILLV